MLLKFGCAQWSQIEMMGWDCVNLVRGDGARQGKKIHRQNLAHEHDINETVASSLIKPLHAKLKIVYYTI